MDSFGFWSLTAAIVTIFASLIFRRVSIGLFLGIVSGTFVLCRGDFAAFVKKSLSVFHQTFVDVERIEIAFFILAIGGMLELSGRSGSFIHLSTVLEKFLNTPQKTRVGSWFLSLSLFFDDYTNLMINGSTMKSLMKKQRVSVAKFAYIADIGSEVASVAVISTWAAFETTLFQTSAQAVGITEPAISLFLKSLPFHAYTFLGIFLTFLVAISGKWFSYRLDNRPIVSSAPQPVHEKATFGHAIYPMILFVFLSLAGCIVLGVYHLKQKGEQLSISQILGSAPIMEVLLGSAVIALLFCFVYLWKDGIVTLRVGFINTWAGFKKMFEVSLIILLANGLGIISENLGTGTFIAGLTEHFLLREWIPIMVFITAAVITVATGFSWTSMSILMPIAYPILVASGNSDLIPIVSGAIVTGAISGAHVIPYSDKSVLCSAACEISPLYHVKTQLLQVLVVWIGSLLFFGMVGHGISPVVGFLAAIIFILTLHKLFAR